MVRVIPAPRITSTSTSTSTSTLIGPGPPPVTGTPLSLPANVISPPDAPISLPGSVTGHFGGLSGGSGGPGGLGGAGARRCGVCWAGTRGAAVPAGFAAGLAAGVGGDDVGSGGIQQQDRATGIAGNPAGSLGPGRSGTSPGWRRSRDRHAAGAGNEGKPGGGVVAVIVTIVVAVAFVVAVTVGRGADVRRWEGGGPVVGQQHCT
ncbi:hypothetical protein GCM10009555_078890 [Acrocarpospora macrocephala]